jgi:fucose permease
MQANTFVAHLPNMMKKMSILHAVYGVGALVCPLVATQFATLEHWSYQYLTSLGLALFVSDLTSRLGSSIEHLTS